MDRSHEAIDQGLWFLLTTDGTNLYFADFQRVLKTNFNGLITGWFGKVANNSGMSGSGCSLNVNDNTPGWCLGGTSRPGFDQRSFRDLESIAFDNQGKLLVGFSQGYGEIRKFDATSGAYEGTLSLESVSPTRWSNNTVLEVERHGFDDNSMFNPEGVHVAGDYIYLAEYSSSRLKKINRKTGALEGWIGALTSTPSGGSLAACLTANPFAASPGWCLGAAFLPNSLFNNSSAINFTSNGIFYTPTAITSDSTYLYVADRYLHRIARYKLSDGTPQGWIGKIHTSYPPTGGDPGCSGSTAPFTPGWCTGGYSASGNGDGQMNEPTSITYTGGNLYVLDGANHRIMSFNAGTGSFNGWIGRIGTGPVTVCSTATVTTGYDVSTNNWCKGGTSAQASVNDKGGGFIFWSNRGGIATDGVNLYVANSYANRIDKISLAGQYLGGTKGSSANYTAGWLTDPVQLGGTYSGCGYHVGLFVDTSNIYSVSAYPCNRASDSFNIVKIDKTSGQVQGWHGAINPSNLPNDGEAGCNGATGSTPGWCKNGQSIIGLTLGGFSDVYGYITGDSDFIYVSDRSGNRVTRIPK